MKRSVVSIMAVAAFAACFDDPTSSLRNGPAQLVLDRSAALIPYNDSLGIEVRVKDAQGNPQVVGPVTFATGSAGIATVNAADVQDGEVVVRANILAHDPVGGVTYVRVTAQGLTDSIRVTSLPTTLPAGSAVVGGTVGPDTLGSGTAFTAGDTITVTPPATMEFSLVAGEESQVVLGNQNAYILSRTATQIRAVARGPYQGSVEVTEVILLANASLGTAAVTLSLATPDQITVAKPRFTGTAAVSSGILLTINAAAGQTFVDAGDDTTLVKFGPDAATVINRTPTTLTVSSPIDYTGGFTLLNVNGGGILLDSVKSSGNISILRATFPGTVAATGPDLLDTLTVTAGAGVTLQTGASPSEVVSGGLPALVISRTAAQMVVVPVADGPVSITNVDVGGTVFPSLTEANDLEVGATSLEPNEPANNASAGATVLNLTAANDASNPLVVYGVMDAVADARDYYTFTMPVTGAITVTLDWFGTGGGADDDNPDHDVVICTTLSGTGACSYGQDIIPANAASSLAQPETGTTPSVANGTIVFMRTFAYFATAGAPNRVYRLTISAQ